MSTIAEGSALAVPTPICEDTDMESDIVNNKNNFFIS
ncbi:hypothetical protein J3D55_001565 [Chryseobacterium ginsenosidimutans]|nr:hypothetical protein [Chryseobacterium ginsenosidimutans]